MPTCPHCGAEVQDPEFRWCPSCGKAPTEAAPAGPAGETPGEAAPELPVRLEIDRGHFYLEAAHGLLPVQITNLTADHLEVELRAQGEVLARGEGPRRLTLQPHARVPMLPALRIHPPRGHVGEYGVHIVLRLTRGQGKYVLHGEVSLWVFEREQSITHFQVLVDNRGGEIYGSDVANAVNQGVRDGAIRTANDLLKLKLAPCMQEVPLFLHSFTQGKEILEVPAGRAQPLAQACLIVSAGRRVCLLTGERISFGRQRPDATDQGADVVLRPYGPSGYLGRTRQTDRLGPGDRISRRHFSLHVEANGRLTLHDEKTKFGTWLDGHKIASGGRAEVALDQPMEIDLADGAMKLRLECFSSAEPADIDATVYQRLFGRRPDTVWEAAGRSGLRAVRLTRMPIREGRNEDQQEIDLPEEYLLVLRWADIGSADSSAIRIQEVGIRPQHARLWRLNGGFWIEAMRNAAPVEIAYPQEGKGVKTLLNPGQLAPLTVGTLVRLGAPTTELRLERFGQCRLLDRGQPCSLVEECPSRDKFLDKCDKGK